MDNKGVLRFFDDDYNCAESVLLEMKEQLNLKCGDIPKMGTPFGAGIGRTSRICGALAGGIIAVGYVLGRRDNSEDKTEAYQIAAELSDKFEEEFGATSCEEISGIDWSSEESVKDYKERVHFETCHKVVEFVCEYLNDKLKERMR